MSTIIFPVCAVYMRCILVVVPHVLASVTGMVCCVCLCSVSLLILKFSHIGRGDECVCFSCGVKMSNWSEQENVWHRHARMSPHCQLLLQEKGQEFVDSVLEEYGAFRQGGRSAVINVSQHQHRLHSTVLFFLCLKFPMSKQKVCTSFGKIILFR